MKTHRRVNKGVPKEKHLTPVAVAPISAPAHTPIVAAAAIPVPTARLKDKSWFEKLFG